MLAQAAAARDAVVRATRELPASLRVGAEQCLGVVDVVSLLDRVHRRYPLVDLDFTQAGSHELVSLVRDGRLDLAFIATERSPRGGDTGSSSDAVRWSLLAAAGPPAGPGRTRPAGPTCRHLDFVDFQQSWAIRSLNDQACAAHGVTRHVRCTVNDVHTLLDLVHRGLGAAIVPQHVAAKPQAAGLVALPMPASAPDWVVSAIAGEPSTANSLALSLIDTEMALTA